MTSSKFVMAENLFFGKKFLTGENLIKGRAKKLVEDNLMCKFRQIQQQTCTLTVLPLIYIQTPFEEFIFPLGIALWNNKMSQTSKSLVCLGSSVLVGVELEGQFPVLFLEICLTGVSRHPQYLIVVSAT